MEDCFDPAPKPLPPPKWWWVVSHVEHARSFSTQNFL